ncbi:flagellar protein FlgN [Photobacterium phosphoreum]|jgi:flagella synthesis protein FlgN|uniref:Flagellar protein FlgN n=1 Tax=Photobacterium phosphoreum TaxID=659 RepID=A0A2T3JXG7_PHOPO|nr:flagellar export chaperone FlgN [Photobacterium phosphoreum]KJF88468.1 molecular chaperone [Photobacterium phosphoreum]MCD9470619.1 molecular chaperone [Photobacterium phosphoreum]MCD9473263.1 flagellar protein FlgN [Photobacterium phosphoreum]MCD9478213.1 flagellar protein FlgN [Photobacterium phosphoreum]MCD9482361.1 flagellar protein FlgN [Photobacterium phosphoreum]
MKHTIEQLLELQHTALVSLAELLNQEKTAIAHRRALEIEQFAKEKLTLINSIQQHDYLLANHPQRQQLQDDQLLSQHVNEIQQLVTLCKQRNDINGEVLQRAQLSFHKLNNLFQQSRGRHQMTYNCDGKAQNVRSLGTNLKA